MGCVLPRSAGRASAFRCTVWPLTCDLRDVNAAGVCLSVQPGNNHTYQHVAIAAALRHCTGALHRWLTLQSAKLSLSKHQDLVLR
jgi:hypothetical protein